ncbi:ATP-dependent DNA helicase RecG [Flocculibacter collagenilyticus]|uniref:ATP-dependent DNA helicase RecG n=1 Tax=Flocculibacter collagenilyticus TaxID=2744479 RepID=UPI0018F6B6FC|nr:ATP-dependent DNA helicase RecG [Flocculibacter collagenilyticus]
MNEVASTPRVAPSRLAAIPITQLKGVGPKMAERLRKIGIEHVQDMLFHLPLRYEDRTQTCDIAKLLPGLHVAVCGEIESCQVTQGRRRTMLVTIKDDTGYMQLRFFHFSAAQKNSLSLGKTIKCFGEIKRGQRGYEIIHPEYSFIGASSKSDNASTEESLTPVYPTTDGLKQASLRNLTDEALHYLQQGMLVELLPDGLYDKQLSITDALRFIHRPPPNANVQALEQGLHPAQQRLILEELLAQNLSMLQLRSQTTQFQAVSLTINTKLEQQFLAQLSFTPTDAQCRVVKEIHNDLRSPHPMMRLVQGDVGSGKTLVAALAALTAIGQGYQVALMAPTELLAEQHANNFKQWLAPLNVSVAWLAGKTKGKVREQTLQDMASGDAQMIVGTHALFQESVIFKNLALIIIDEQHRFGVHQRLALREKGKTDISQGTSAHFPHQLVMTATPIPRTLAMTAYADLDTSIIDELPPGRTPITTVAVPDNRRQQIIERVKQCCLTESRQAYWVCTLIEESDVLQCQAAEDTAQSLQTALPELKIGLVHGRMKAAEKQAIMADFKAGKLHLLVATTVIEVGVDVPNASLMIIENPERLGLAQLHQLRGRVGRGSVASHCVLLYQAPLTVTAQKRLGVLRDSNDGFVIAQRDLEIRGPGEVLGTRQTGLAQLRIADLQRDGHLLPQVKKLAHHLWQHYPDNAKWIMQRWIANRTHYSNA